MLETGNLWGPLGDAEDRSSFSMWCVMKAPLILGTDVTNMSATTLATLTNKAAIAINQDPLGEQARLVGPSSANATTLTWVGSLSGGGFVALVVNNDISPHNLQLDVSSVIPSGSSRTYMALEVWSGKSQSVTPTSTLSFPNIGGHDCVLIRFSE